MAAVLGWLESVESEVRRLGGGGAFTRRRPARLPGVGQMASSMRRPEVGGDSALGFVEVMARERAQLFHTKCPRSSSNRLARRQILERTGVIGTAVWLSMLLRCFQTWRSLSKYSEHEYGVTARVSAAMPFMQLRIVRPEDWDSEQFKKR